MVRARMEQGFGMVELLIAMTVMNVAVMAIVAAFTSGTVAVTRASKVTTAATVADAQMETYRAMTSRDIGLDLSSGTIAALPSSYTSDSSCANAGTSKTCSVAGVAATLSGPTGANTCTTVNSWYPSTLPCTPSRTISGSGSPDGRSYRIDTYVALLPAINANGTTARRSRKQVTVVVRDGMLPTKVLVRETSIFDCSTGVTPNSNEC
jgi:type II secretory pathway pseudopilin PulG